jgi:ferrochelatase
MIPPADHPRLPPARIGVLLINLGTPDEASPAAVRRYLAEFLSDRRVVEIPQLVWQPILRGVVLRTRPKKSAHAYSQVWTPAGSPLAAITAAQSKALENAFGEGVRVDYAMRYGSPAIGERLRAMKEAGCTRILLAPLYPQYCAATTATANDEAFRQLAAMRWQPAIRTLPPYFDDARYIAALKTSIETQLAQAEFEPDAIMASFHGMPERTLHMGDPYHCHCQKTGRLLTEALKEVLQGRELIVTFQSRFGKAKWLEPYTDVTLEQLPGRGIRKLAVVAPGFSADCLETLEELAIRGKESFMGAGGEHFGYLACLNDSRAGIDMLRSVLRTELEGWLPPS